MDSASNGISFTVYKGSPSRRIVKGTTLRDQLHGDEVLIRITHSSLCGTDELSPAMSKEAASALMCGGATVFNVLDIFNIKPTERVGIIGIGGLGHLAISFAAKWGCEVVVFSATEAKREHAMQLGATEFYSTKVEKFEGIAPIDHLMVTTSQQIPWPLYMSIMASPGTIYPLTVSADDLKIPYTPFLFSGLRIQASIVAPRVIYKRMLRFAEFHGIEARLQRYRLDEAGIEEAMADLREGRMRYRGVLCASE